MVPSATSRPLTVDAAAVLFAVDGVLEKKLDSVR
jgi:hypothetical protein